VNVHLIGCEKSMMCSLLRREAACGGDGGGVSFSQRHAEMLKEIPHVLTAECVLMRLGRSICTAYICLNMCV
jgi:hypothetical protein